MTAWNPSVVKIENIKKHSNADRLLIVNVMGDYPVITNMMELKIGDIIGFLPIDTIVPDTKEFHFLSPMQYEKFEENGEIVHRPVGRKYEVGSVPEKYRTIKAKKILGIYSEGMLQPLPEGDWKVGDPIIETFNLKKWEEDEEENVQLAKTKGRNAEKPPKGWNVPYYDVDSLRKYIDCLHEDEEIVLTEKLHGSNAAFCHDGERLWVKSRNFFKKMDPDDMWWEIAIRFNLEEKLAKFPMHVFFGEVYGNVKGFGYDCEVVKGKRLPRVRFFDVYNPKTGQYLDYDDRVAMIVEAGLDPVPELYRGLWGGKQDMYPYAEGSSTLNEKHVREGFVLNTTNERFEERLQSRMQVKLIGQMYNLNK